ncbi:MAG: hypothetical protein ABIO04_00675 [Ferruginibacter sp.]
MKIAILSTLFFMCMNLSATEKTNPFVSSFKQSSTSNAFLFLRGHKQGQGHNLQWSMNSNSGIEKFRVEFTYEDASDPYSNWYTAGMVNNTNSNIFKFTDMGCAAGYINYRVIALMNNNGGSVVSQTYSCIIN